MLLILSLYSVSAPPVRWSTLLLSSLLMLLSSVVRCESVVACFLHSYAFLWACSLFSLICTLLPCLLLLSYLSWYSLFFTLSLSHSVHSLSALIYRSSVHSSVRSSLIRSLCLSLYRLVALSLVSLSLYSDDSNRIVLNSFMY